MKATFKFYQELLEFNRHTKSLFFKICWDLSTPTPQSPFLTPTIIIQRIVNETHKDSTGTQ